MSRTPRYETRPNAGPLWAAEPFRIFFPLGLLVAVFGLVLWPMHYFGWWPVYPAIQHPRLLIFGFGAAFVFGFLGTAWPRFLESEALRVWEVVVLSVLWLVGQVSYARAAITEGDLIACGSFVVLLVILGRRLFSAEREFPPPGFAVAFLSVFLASLTLLGWGLGWAQKSPEWFNLHRLLGYQGFLLFPLLGVGSYLFPRFLASGEGTKPEPTRHSRRAHWVWISSGIILVSFFVEAFVSTRFGNFIRIAGIVSWMAGAVPMLFVRRGGTTRAWSLRFGIGLILLALVCRILWPREEFAFEHLLFLSGFTQLILLVADRVAHGHGGDLKNQPPRSLRWRWIVWLMLLTAATRATADLVPTTRVSHHIYAAVMLIGIFVIWWWMNGRCLWRNVREEER